MKIIIKCVSYILLINIVVLSFFVISPVKCITEEDEKKRNVNKVSSDDTVNSSYERIIAITFDDGPNKKTTEVLLNGLRERNVKATFFLIGENIDGNEQLIKQMQSDGHLIGNHTYTHIKLDSVNDGAALDEIKKTNEKIMSITGAMPVYIRPPYGVYSSHLLNEVSMTPVLWSVDPDDWATHDSSLVVRRVLKNVKNGDIILMHDIYESSVYAALEVIDELKNRGYIFVTVDQLLLD